MTIKNITVPSIPPVIRTRQGFYCKSCGGKMRVYWSRPIGGCVVRQRICDKCGVKTKTTEN